MEILKINEDLPPTTPIEPSFAFGAGMGAIVFPRDGHIGSGDVVSGTDKVYVQKPLKNILSFDEFTKKIKKKKHGGKKQH